MNVFNKIMMRLVLYRMPNMNGILLIRSRSARPSRIIPHSILNFFSEFIPTQIHPSIKLALKFYIHALLM